jgi:zinc transporter ZupT
MTPIVQLYWLRVSLGIVAAVVTAVLAKFLFASTPGDFTPLINSITVALLIYFITYYVLKPIYKDKIEKQSKILSTGIGMYFFTWIAFFVLLYTIFQVYFP